MLEFRGDAIVLSGSAGSELKTSILSDYYDSWWKITSGGQRENYRYNTAIVDLNAATGELYIKDTRRTVLGSAGHALALKYDSGYSTEFLKLALVEEDPECYTRLKRVIGRRWRSVPVREAEGPSEQNHCGVHLLNTNLEDALETIDRLRLGSSIFFFDPLLHIEWDTVERVARSRITSPFHTGTEFMIFVFTSDWFTGRQFDWRADLAPLPSTPDEDEWNQEEAEAVTAADGLFGDENWHEAILTSDPSSTRESAFIHEYERRLHTWFRWVLPLPFIPKGGQLYHLIFCSNYEAGIRVTRDFYCDYTGNPKYSPNNPAAYARFCRLHPESLEGLTGMRRPVEWKVLWQIIRECEGGLCDAWCPGFESQGSRLEVRRAMGWLSEAGYLSPAEDLILAWPNAPQRFKLDWRKVEQDLGVSRPAELRPITPGAIRRSGRPRR